MKRKLFNKEEEGALKVFVKLMRAYESVNRLSNGSFKEMNITETQFGILEALYHLGSMCQSELGKKVLKSKGNITLVIDNLEKNGLIVRKRSDTDRRYISVSLTAKGNSYVEEIFPNHAKQIYRIFSVLNNEEKIVLGSLCKKLGTQAID